MKFLFNLLLASLFFASGPAALQAETSEEFYQVIERCRKNPEKWPAIAYAVKINHPDAVKFLIDRQEPVDAETPDKPVWYEGGTYFDSIYRAGRNEPGYTALELAVIQQDPQLVAILLTHNSKNKANPELKHLRYVHLRPYGEGYLDETYPPLRTHETSPLWHALQYKNAQLADLLLRAYTTPEKLFSELKPIAHQQDRTLMKSWIEQNVALWKGQQIDTADTLIDLFLNATLPEAIELNQMAYVEHFLQGGWMVSQKEFESAIQKQNKDMIERLLAHDRFLPGWNPYDHLMEKGLEDCVEKYFTSKMLLSFAKFNRADLLEKFFDQADENTLPSCFFIAIESGSLDVIAFFQDKHIYLEGALLHAVKNKQKAAVELLLKGLLSREEMEEAAILAYQLSAYDIFELITSALR